MTRKSAFERHIGTMLGIASTCIPGFLGIEDLITKAHQKYWLAASIAVGAIITQRGLAQAKKDKLP